MKAGLYLVECVLVLSLFINSVEGLCQGAMCVPNASCQNNECTCNAGFVGEGRFLCKPQATECVCVSFGDPHTLSYDGMVRTTQVLPCNYILSIYATSTGCIVSVVAETVEQPGKPFSSIISRTAVTVVLAGISQTIFLNSVGVQSNASNIVVADLSTPDVTTVALPQCATTVNYRNNGATGLAAPKIGSGFLPNLCGNCDGQQNDIPPPFVIGRTPAERDLAFSLRNLAQVQPLSPEGAICTNLKAIVTLPNCATDAQLARATSIQNGCGALLPNPVFLQCAQNASLPSSAVYGAFRDCMNFYCSGNTAAACITVAQLYAGLSCPPPPGYSCP